MSTFVTSRGTRCQHVAPRFEVPYRPAPARREHIHGRVRSSNDKLVNAGRRIPSGKIAIVGALVIAGFFGFQQFGRPLLGGRSAASTASMPPGSGHYAVPLSTREGRKG